MRLIFYVLCCCCLLTGCQTSDIFSTFPFQRNNSGPSIEVRKRSVIVADGTFFTAMGKRVHVRGADFVIPSSEGRQYTNEPFELVEAAAKDKITWQHAPAGTKVWGLAQPNALVNTSLRIKKKPGREPSDVINPQNYIVNSTWPLIYAATGRGHVSQSTLIDYVIRQQRLCTLACDEDGNVKLLLGPLSLSSPVPPDLPTGLMAIANVLAPPFNEDLVKADVMPILANTAETITKVDNATVTKTLAKLHQGKPVEIAFIGDSVTCGACASDPSKSFPQLFISRLRKSYPLSHITYSLIAKGGTGSSTEFAAFEKRGSKADLVIIEFINDVSLDKQTLMQIYEPFLNQIKLQGAEAIICLPHLCNSTLFGLKPNDWQAVERKPFYSVIPQIAKRHNAGCADVCLRSRDIYREGLTPLLLLADRQMHPNDRGHELYVEELLKFFR